MDLQIKNITNYPYENYSGSLEKTTYISKIGIYDEDKNLIAISKLQSPILRQGTQQFVVKFD